MPLRLDELSWIHGSADCATSTDPPLQVVSVDDDTHVLRQSKCFSFEAPFIYLLMGSEKAVLFDTGAGPDDGDPRKILPIRAAIETLLSRRAAAGRAISELVIAHTHGHGDHVFWDGQFAGRPQTRVIGRGVSAVQHAFDLPAWPEGQSIFDLGGRALIVLPLPGHVSDHIAVYDPRMQALLTGDALYPGLLTVADWAAYRRSAACLATFASEHPVSFVLGNHIEMKKTPGELYPLGTTFQPDEHPLPLSAEMFAEWHRACETIGNSPQRVARDHFIIEPR
ncbi:MBL fold metallo-hydrolase (plasmid) [Bradyrhizobium barranii subsp. barranii]|uniref:MBL fold metallo-hydrolase n=1 Tax=Bradyrhizobium barranii subsp. barranii TaxID=2823807 RepID=A0A7Z0QQE9_9BRAD|nr:MBL fold metallo-hydrolase [Bradyrhizobium barranii]UGX89812.1 MBL fold metallo-hydrolase [Bradyrhizobium barranii subsp. barranii]